MIWSSQYISSAEVQKLCHRFAVVNLSILDPTYHLICSLRAGRVEQRKETKILKYYLMEMGPRLKIEDKIKTVALNFQVDFLYFDFFDA